MKDSDKYSYNVKGAAEYLGISKTGIYALRRTGHIRCIVLGRNYVFPKKELDRFNDKCRNDISFNSEVRKII